MYSLSIYVTYITADCAEHSFELVDKEVGKNSISGENKGDFSTIKCIISSFSSPDIMHFSGFILNENQKAN